MLFYEYPDNMNPEYFSLKYGKNLNYPLHIHRLFEVMVVTKGKMMVKIDNADYTLFENDAVVIFPNQMHSFETVSESEDKLCLFSPELVGFYYGSPAETVPENSVVNLTGNPILDLFMQLDESADLNRVKGVMCYLCGMIAEKTNMIKRDTAYSSNGILLAQILEFVQKNLQNDCRLKTLAQEVRYDYSYLSKFFSESVGMNYNEYVNQSRTSRAGYLLKNTKADIVEICYECGYSSLRSFNRNFLKITGLSPSAYRKQG